MDIAGKLVQTSPHDDPSLNQALRALLHTLNPSQKACPRGTGRVPLKKATPQELYDAIIYEYTLSQKRLPGGRPAYREAELHYQKATHSATSGAIDVGECPSPPGVITLKEGLLFGFDRHPGAYLIRGALTHLEQEALVRSSLRSWVERPNRRNFDAYISPDKSNLLWATEHGQGGMALPKKGAHAAVAASSDFPCNLWQEFVEATTTDAATAPVTPPIIDSLTWSTLGYQYDWTSRAYHLPGDPDYGAHTEGHAEGGARWEAPFPRPLARLCAGLAEWVEGVLHSSSPTSSSASPPTLTPFIPQAAIVNVYRGAAKLKLPMGGHKDDMERTMQRPVVSISLGCPGIFLMGGDSKEEPPTPILLRTGDVFILSGRSRKSFHGVAKVFEGEGEGLLFSGRVVAKEEEGEEDGEGERDAGTGSTGSISPLGLRLKWGWEGEDACKVGSAEEERAFKAFINTCRLNINVRQVTIPEGGKEEEGEEEE